MAGQRISAQVLEKPAHTVIRHQAERLLKEADKAVRRLKDAHDAEALHDSRVALRRLRGWFQAFQVELPLKHKWRRALKQLAHSSNDARDAQVCQDWLSKLKRCPDAQFSAELDALRKERYHEVRDELPAKWRRLARRLRRTAAELGTRGSPFRRRFTASLRSYAQDFERARIQAHRWAVPSNIHALRIAGKKLRYLLDVILKREAVTDALMTEIEELHDSAGSIQDLQRLQALAEQGFLRRADKQYHRLLTARSTRRHPGLAPELVSLLQIGRAARREQIRRIARFRKAYLEKTSPRYVRELRRVIRGLESR